MFNLPFASNMLAKKMEKRYKKQPEYIRKRLDKMEEMEVDEYQLKVIKRKRAYPEIGDVFAINPVQNTYFWGVVINNHLDNMDGEDLLVIMVFDEKIDISESRKFYPHYDNLLINPCIVGSEYWTKGFFYNVGKIEELQVPNYGFYDIMDNNFFDEYGKRINGCPSLWGMRGVCTISGIGYEIYYELIVRRYI